MKLKHFILILSFILSVPSLAQAGGIKISGGTKGKGFDLAQVQAILTRRLEASYRQAREAQLRTRPTFPTEGPRKGELIKPAAFPTREITPHLNFRDPSQVYPDVPFLTTSQQVETYLISKSNRAIPQELEHLADHAQKVANHMITFFQETFLCEQPVQQIPWLINRIPSNVNYFFLGEMHGYLEVRYAMAQFLRGLKQRFP
jgi:hypothetical protein